MARRQLLALGFSAKAIEHRLRTRRLHRVAWGVYAVGRRELNREGRWMAAVLSCGDAAALSHRSAAALWGIAVECPGRIDVSVRRDCHLRRPGVEVRVRAALPAERVGRRLWIPVTTPVQTLVDLATELVDDALERAVNEADTRDLIDPESEPTVVRDILSRTAALPLRPA